jgi:hypothetical protein
MCPHTAIYVSSYYYVSSYSYICVLMLLMSSYYDICVLILLPPLVYYRCSCGAQLAFPSIRRTVLLRCRCVECPLFILLHMWPHTTDNVAAYYCIYVALYYYICAP